MPFEFDSLGAVTNDTIKFHYTGSPNCDRGQGAIPYDIVNQAEEAIQRSTGSSFGTGTGIIRHPFDADYGYPAYDLDFWASTSTYDKGFWWQSGWYFNGYWAFYVKPQPDGPFNYATIGIAAQELTKRLSQKYFFLR